jgi:hypothetical protein
MIHLHILSHKSCICIDGCGWKWQRGRSGAAAHNTAAGGRRATRRQRQRSRRTFFTTKNWKILRTVSSSLQYQHQAKNPNRDKANVNTRKNKKNRLQSEGLSVFQNTQFAFRQISNFYS